MRPPRRTLAECGSERYTDHLPGAADATERRLFHAAYRTETSVLEDRTLTLRDLPFAAGEGVQVIIFPSASEPRSLNQYPLRGKPVHYEDPTEPVAVEDWEALR